MRRLTVAYGLFNALSLFEYSKEKKKKKKKKEREYCYRKKKLFAIFFLSFAYLPSLFFLTTKNK
jgi:hypothetical protein